MAQDLGLWASTEFAHFAQVPDTGAPDARAQLRERVRAVRAAERVRPLAGDLDDKLVRVLVGRRRALELLVLPHVGVLEVARVHREERAAPQREDAVVRRAPAAHLAHVEARDDVGRERRLVVVHPDLSLKPRARAVRLAARARAHDGGESEREKRA